MKRHLQCAEQPDSPSNLAKCRASHVKWHAWSPPHMKRHLQCSEQPDSPSNLPKCCASHAKWLSWLIPLTYETSFTMLGATALTFQRHQILRLPPKMTLMIEPAQNIWNVIYNARSNSTLQPHQVLRLPRKITLMIEPAQNIWNVIYNAQGNMTYPPTSPNAAPAKQNCTPKSKRNLLKADERSFTLPGRSKYDPSTIRTQTRHLAPARSLRLLFELRRRILCWKLQHFALPMYPNFTKYCACHEMWRSNISKCCACHEKWDSNVTKYCACHERQYSNITKYCACLTEWLLNCYLTELLLDWAVTELNCYWTVTCLNCYLTELFVSWLNC